MNELRITGLDSIKQVNSIRKWIMSTYPNAIIEEIAYRYIGKKHNPTDKNGEEIVEVSDKEEGIVSP